jgi:tripartite-type tricarboxylate transporter receptor subunit TctC
MTLIKPRVSRRSFLKTAAAVGAGAAVPFGLTRGAFAQEYPARPLQVVIPTGEGGGVDQAARAFTRVWAKHLGANFEFSYYPGASGQVGYEVFLGRTEANAYNLLFGNIAPEMIMYATQNPNFTYPDDITYLASIDFDDSVIWVPSNSRFQTIEDLIEEGQSRPITLSTSRLPHPSTIGALLLAEQTGMEIRMIPYGGGGPARSAAITGEVDGCATFLSSSLGTGDQVRFLGVFNDENKAPELTNDAPSFNAQLGLDMPPMYGQRAWAIQTSAIAEHPERIEMLQQTMLQVFEDPEYREVAERAGTPWQFIEYGDAEACHATALATLELAERYRDVLSG